MKHDLTAKAQDGIFTLKDHFKWLCKEQKNCKDFFGKVTRKFAFDLSEDMKFNIKDKNDIYQYSPCHGANVYIKLEDVGVMEGWNQH